MRVNAFEQHLRVYTDNVLDPMVLDAVRSPILRRARGLTKLQGLRTQFRELYMRWQANPEHLLKERRRRRIARSLPTCPQRVKERKAIQNFETRLVIETLCVRPAKKSSRKNCRLIPGPGGV